MPPSDCRARFFRADDLGLTAPMPLQNPSAAIDQPYTQAPLSNTEVCYVGQPIAVLVAPTAAQAIDAAEFVIVDYDPLPAWTDHRSALDPNTPIVHVDSTSNHAATLSVGFGEVEALRPAVCLDVSDVAPQTDITPDHLDEALETAGINVDVGDHCFFYTATYDRYHDTPQYLTTFPGLGDAACQWILDKGITTFGVDSPTPDNPASTEYPVHLICRHEERPTTRIWCSLRWWAGGSHLSAFP